MSSIVSPWKWLVWMPTLLALAQPGAPQSSSERPLMARAAHVPVSTKTWDGAVYWLSDHEIAFFRHLPIREKVGHYTRVLYRRDLRTGAEKRLDAFSRLYNGVQGASATPLSMSPDRRWLLWTDYEEKMYVARLDGSHYQHWKVRNVNDPVLWSPDSRSIISVDFDPSGHTAIKRYVDDPESVEAFPLDVDEGAHLSQSDDLRVVNDFGDDSLLIIKRHPGGPVADEATGKPAEVWEATTWERPPHARKFTVPLPTGAQLEETATSTNGGRIAWLLLYGGNRARRVGLWVWTLKDRRMREIGHMDVKGGDDRGPVSDIAWLPDGKRLSFRYKDALWTVSVD